MERMEEMRVAVQVGDALSSLSPSDAALITLTMFEHYSRPKRLLPSGSPMARLERDFTVRGPGWPRPWKSSPS